MTSVLAAAERERARLTLVIMMVTAAMMTMTPVIPRMITVIVPLAFLAATWRPARVCQAGKDALQYASASRRPVSARNQPT